MKFELPTLGEAANEIYKQHELFESGRPNQALTGLDLLILVVRDIEAELADSNSFDPQLLRHVAKFRRFFKSGPFSAFRIEGSESASIGEIEVKRAAADGNGRSKE